MGTIGISIGNTISDVVFDWNEADWMVEDLQKRFPNLTVKAIPLS